MGTVWAEDQCLHTYNMAEGMYMTMHPWQIIVKLESTGDTMSLQVFPTDTIGSVKFRSGGPKAFRQGANGSLSEVSC